MLLTKPQLSRFWRTWSRIIASRGWSPAEAEAQRKALLARAGFSSLTLVDRTAGFDRLLAELAVLQDDLSRAHEASPAPTLSLPAGHGTQVQPDNPGTRRRLLYLIRRHASALGGHAYLRALVRDRFGRDLDAGMSGLDDLPTPDLHQLLITLAARHASHLQAGRNASLTSEESYPDQVDFPADPPTVECPF